MLLTVIGYSALVYSILVYDQYFGIIRHTNTRTSGLLNNTTDYMFMPRVLLAQGYEVAYSYVYIHIIVAVCTTVSTQCT